MRLDKIQIKNFKSIQFLEFDIKKYSDSYTTMLLGINEVGKSNILQAMSFLNVPTEDFNYSDLHHQKDTGNNDVDLYFYFSFENKKTYLDEIKTKVHNGEILKFELINIEKNVYLRSPEKKFKVVYSFEVNNLAENLFIKKIAAENFAVSNESSDETFVPLTREVFEEHFESIIINIIKKYENRAMIWKPSKEYLLTSVNLHEFKNNIESNIPLKNIFILAGYDNLKKINEQINQINIMHLRKMLMKTLSVKTTEYIKSIWNHDINLDIEITEQGIFNVSIKDDGEKNEFNYYPMDVRSEGFKQFISLILSLSIESRKIHSNRLILIDEPETHLHPSGIRDLGKELLEIGKDNYLFVSTHSPFIIDKKQKERNIIIKKDYSAYTIKKEIHVDDDIHDDQVLEEAFGINVYKDLLIPHRILVEGKSDQLILKRSFQIKECPYGITNGTGSNIITLASKLNYEEIKILVLVDDDAEGKKYKEDILKIGGVFSEVNVFTIRDLVVDMIGNGTIEDLLGQSFVESKFNEFYRLEFDDESSLNLNDSSAYLEQIKQFLSSKNKYSKDVINKFKIKISNDFKPSKSSFDTKFPLLKKLIDKIKDHV